MASDIPTTPIMLTHDLPGFGGRIKSFPEDFQVEEIPAYQPCGDGDFLYLCIEKRDMGADYFIRQIARRLGISDRDVGSAGLKDRRAVTRQMISVPAAAEKRLAELDGDGIKVLNVSRHTNKLKPGHLHGNRFRILIRDIDSGISVEESLTPILSRLREQGMPNFYGAQRFGRDGGTLQLGMALLRNEPIPQNAAGRKPHRKNPFLRKLALSAAQSALFNRYLNRRMTDGFFRQVLLGDVMSKWPAGGLFVVEDVLREQQRFDCREIVTTGPIFGRKTFAAAQFAAEREAAILHEMNLTVDSFRNFGKLMQGTRRHNLVYIDDLAFTVEPAGVQLTFTLPAGSYATVLLREVMKTNDLDLDENGQPL